MDVVSAEVEFRLDELCPRSTKVQFNTWENQPGAVCACCDGIWTEEEFGGIRECLSCTTGGRQNKAWSRLSSGRNGACSASYRLTPNCSRMAKERSGPEGSSWGYSQ